MILRVLKQVGIAFAVGSFAGVLLAGCGGGGGASSPKMAPAVRGALPSKSSMSMSIRIPASSRNGAAADRHAKFVSSSTNGIAVTVWQSPQPKPATPSNVFDISNSSGTCTGTLQDGTTGPGSTSNPIVGARNCAITVGAPNGNSNFFLQTTDSRPVNNTPFGAVLAEATVTGYPIQLPPAVNALHVVLAGIVSGVILSPSPLAVTAGIVSSDTIGIAAYDPDGQLIVGAYDFPVRLTLTDPSTHLQVSDTTAVPGVTAQTPGTTVQVYASADVTLLQYDGGAYPGATSSSVAASSSASSPVSFSKTSCPTGDICTVSVENVPAVASANVTVPAAALSFFHEFAVPTTFNTHPFEIATGPSWNTDGNFWFTERTAAVGHIGSITPSGVITQYTLPAGGFTTGIATDTADFGNMWAVGNNSSGGGQLIEIAPNGFSNSATIALAGVPTPVASDGSYAGDMITVSVNGIASTLTVQGFEIGTTAAQSLQSVANDLASLISTSGFGGFAFSNNNVITINACCGISSQFPLSVSVNPGTHTTATASGSFLNGSPIVETALKPGMCPTAITQTDSNDNMWIADPCTSALYSFNVFDFERFSAAKARRSETTGRKTAQTTKRRPANCCGSSPTLNGPIQLASAPNGVTFGSDSENVWYTRQGYVGSVDIFGQTVIAEYPTPGDTPGYITQSTNDDAMWFTVNAAGGAQGTPAIGRISTFNEEVNGVQLVPGSYIKCALSSSVQSLGEITTGPDGAMWFPESPGALGRISMNWGLDANSNWEELLPATCQLQTAGANLVVSSVTRQKQGSSNQPGAYTEYPVGASGLNGILASGDSCTSPSLWLTDPASNLVAQTAFPVNCLSAQRRPGSAQRGSGQGHR